MMSLRESDRIQEECYVEYVWKKLVDRCILMDLTLSFFFLAVFDFCGNTT